MFDIRPQVLQCYRQGDVVLVPCAEIPGHAQAWDAEDGRVVLARGESTGHAHAMTADRVCYFREDGSGGGAFIRVAGSDPVDLVHEEHDALAIPPGDYRVIQQREYQPQAAPRVVVD